MPKAFDRCVKNGGRVKTKKLKGNKYMRICWLNGKSYAGEIKTKKKKKVTKRKKKKKTIKRRKSAKKNR